MKLNKGIRLYDLETVLRLKRNLAFKLVTICVIMTYLWEGGNASASRHHPATRLKGTWISVFPFRVWLALICNKHHDITYMTTLIFVLTDEMVKVRTL